MKRILFVMNTMGQGGAETALLELLRRIDKQKYIVDLFVITGQGEMISRLPQNVNLLNTEFCDLPVLDTEGRKALKKTVLRSLFKRANIIRLFPYLFSNLFKMVKGKDIRTDKLLWRVLSDGAMRIKTEYDLAVSYLEGGSAYYVADHVKAKRKAAFIHVDYNLAGYSRKLDRDCYLKDDRIFCVSDEVKNVFTSVYPECREKTEVFHNLIDSDGIRAKANETDSCITEWKKAKENGKVLLTVGRLTAQKALDVSIRACKKLIQNGENIKWFVFGEGDLRKELEAVISEENLEGIFMLPGVTTNPYPYITQADVYVHCSRFEGKSIAIQEAQILGKAMVVTDCSGNREQVVDGKDGLMCNLDANEIAESISKLIHSPELCEKLGNAASMKVTDEAKELKKLYSLI